MIDQSLFTVERLLKTFLNSDTDVNWRQLATIIPNYMPPYPDSRTRPRCVVKCGDSFLRHSAGPRQEHFWDCYGDDYLTPELALLALMEAPVPYSMFDRKVFKQLQEDPIVQE